MKKIAIFYVFNGFQTLLKHNRVYGYSV